MGGVVATCDRIEGPWVMRSFADAAPWGDPGPLGDGIPLAIPSPRGGLTDTEPRVMWTPVHRSLGDSRALLEVT